MALAETETNHNEKNTEITKSTEKKEKPLTKVVIRRLPPGITQDSFLQQVSPVPDYNYIYTVKGDMSLGENSFSRVYINFTNPEDIFVFKEKFDNYVFVDTKGHEYPAVVEFAAFQKVPKRRGKIRTDNRCGTIENDPLYIDFLESLKNQPNQDEKPEFCYQPSSENKNDASTPLLEFIKQRRMDRQRIRDEKKEERRKKEFERKRLKDDERKKSYDEKPLNKGVVKATISSSKFAEGKEKNIEDNQEEKSLEKVNENESAYEKSTNVTLTYRNRDRKFDDRKPTGYKSKSKFGPRTDSDYYDRRDTYKNRREDTKDKDYKKKIYEDKKEAKVNPKKIKKYSERREELKAKQIVTKEAERKETGSEETKVIHEKTEKKDQFTESKSEEGKAKEFENSTKQSLEVEKSKQEKNLAEEAHEGRVEKDSRNKNKENDPRLQRRIRNKDRPTMDIYRPGMLRKKQVEGGDTDSNPGKCSSSEKE